MAGLYTPLVAPREWTESHPNKAFSEYEKKKLGLRAILKRGQDSVRLGKATSNLFRDRLRTSATRLDVHAFNRVLDVDAAAGTVDAEGMTSYEKLAAATFEHGMLPAVVPQLKSITIGGAVAGLGIESSAFRYGLVHETVEEMDVLLADGDIVLCRPDNEHSDLFFGMPNAFGTLGYSLRVKAKAIPAKPFVALAHHRHTDLRDYFRALEHWCASDADYVDGVIFGPGEYYITTGRFVETAPYASDYTYLNIYYRSIRERSTDFLKTLDYIWRWDTDWFWCSRVLLAQNPIVRRLLGRKHLNSTFYKKITNLNNRWQARSRLRSLFGIHSETIIQDVDVPIRHAQEFYEFFARDIGLVPVWICPFREYAPEHVYPLFPVDPNTLYVNFGFWDAVTSREHFEEGHFNRLIEKRIMELGGTKSLYSDSYFTPEEFRALYNGNSYDALKKKYDPHGRLGDLYRKCVLRE